MIDVTHNKIKEAKTDSLTYHEVSVVICTYNRAQLLAECLESLCHQTVPIDDVDIIVVDNNSTDETRAVVESFQDRLLRLRYVFEKKQGLSHARNRGYSEATTEWVAYLDDDAKAHPDYIESILKAIREHRFDCIGGLFLPWYKFGKPKWYKDSYGSNVEKLSNPEDRRFAPGGNMIIRKDILVEMGGFSDYVGMSGEKVSYGEETRLQLAMRTKGYSYGLDERIRIDHLVARYKLSPWWFTKSAYSVGKDYWATFLDEPSIGKVARRLAYASYNLIKNLVKNTPRLFTERDYYLQNLYIDSTQSLAVALGAFSSYLSHIRNPLRSMACS